MGKCVWWGSGARRGIAKSDVDTLALEAALVCVSVSSMLVWDNGYSDQMGADGFKHPASQRLQTDTPPRLGRRRRPSDDIVRDNLLLLCCAVLFLLSSRCQSRISPWLISMPVCAVASGCVMSMS